MHFTHISPGKKEALNYQKRVLRVDKSPDLLTFLINEWKEGARTIYIDNYRQFKGKLDRRKMSVMKMRNTKHTLKPQDIVIDDGGIKIV